VIGDRGEPVDLRALAITTPVSAEPDAALAVPALTEALKGSRRPAPLLALR
jgi:hypothetical protein